MERIADYRLVRLIGEGSNGRFFLAAAPPRLGIPDEHVAVKVLEASTDKAAFSRMTKELRAFAAVPSAHLVTLYDAGQEADRFYYAMEYCPLGSLASPARPLTREEILEAVAHAARATHELHEAGMAHRDIKPANIMLTGTGGKLADLGLAQVMSPGQTVTGMGAIGSIEYLDPSILRGERASRASDIWALGVTLHRVLTGRSVYGELPDRDPLFAVRRVLNSQPAIDPDLGAGEGSIIRACLETDPAARLRTAAEVASRIEALGAAS